MYFVSLQAYIPGFTPTKMQRKYPKYPLYLRSDSRKNSISLLLSGTQRPVSPRFGQYPVKFPLFTTSPLQLISVISLVGKYGSLLPFHKLIYYLRIVNLGRCTNKFRHKLRLWINRNMILVTVNCFVALFAKGGILIFARTSGSFDQTGINNFARAKFKALLSDLAFKFGETFAVEVHSFEVRTEARDSGMVRDGVKSREAEEAAVEEVTFEHEFHFGVGVAVDLLDDKDFEHEDGVIGFAADLSGVDGGQDIFERIPIDELIDA
jgi:hypothetical protein